MELSNTSILNAPKQLLKNNFYNIDDSFELYSDEENSFSLNNEDNIVYRQLVENNQACLKKYLDKSWLYKIKNNINENIYKISLILQR